MTLVVASIIENSVREASESSKQAFREGADIVELRLDMLEGFGTDTVREVRREIPGPAMATLRSRDQGGGSRLGCPEREEVLKAILASGFEYVDLELGTDRRLIESARTELDATQIIVSDHLHSPTRRNIVERRLAEAMRFGDIAKIAVPCENAVQALDLAQLGRKYSRLKKRFALVGMGPQGQLTRVLADRIGSELAYACLAGKEAAPGQLDVPTQAALLGKVDRTVLGLVGHPVSHSISKPMQETALRHRGLTGVYLPLDFPGRRFDGNSLRLLNDLGFSGLNVTIPHKSAAFRLCAAKSDFASSTRAVNTITFKGRRAVGENTDVAGFSRLIDGKTNITGNTDALVIGAGGAARAVAFVLSERKVRITITDIDVRRAKNLARPTGATVLTVNGLWRSDRAFDLVVNCTPVGMKGVPGTPLKASFLKAGAMFIDIVYNPPVTQAMEIAARRGAKAYGGLEMLVQQGAESFREWTGLEPNVEAMREAARRALQ